jgi:hypothetical protein
VSAITFLTADPRSEQILVGARISETRRDAGHLPPVMTVMTRSLLLLSTLLAAVPAASAQPAPVRNSARVTPPFAGRYVDALGTLEISVEGTRLRGFYRGADERGALFTWFDGAIAGGVAKGTFRTRRDGPSIAFEMWFDAYGALMLDVGEHSSWFAREGGDLVEERLRPAAKPAPVEPARPAAAPAKPKIEVPKDRGNVAAMTGCFGNATYVALPNGGSFYSSDNVFFNGKGVASRAGVIDSKQVTAPGQKYERRDEYSAIHPDEGTYVVKGNEVKIFWNDGAVSLFLMQHPVDGKPGYLRTRNGTPYTRGC